MNDISRDSAAIDLLHDLIGRARRAGADAADAVLFEGTSLSHGRRLGKTEKLERSEGQDLGLRVFIGRQQAIVSSSDRSPKALGELVERAVAMAKTVPEDPYCGIAEPDEIARDWPALDMFDPEEPSAEVLIERARAAEEAALAVEGVTNSEGAEAGWGRSEMALVASNGFAGTYRGSSHGVSASVIGGTGTGMERDYDYSSAVYAADLRDPAEIGKSAGERAVKRLGARKMPTCRCPVVFDPRVARSFISHLLGAISGPSIARGTSFLKDRLGERIFPEAITIVDDPHRRRGLRSKPFDGEGIANHRRAIVDKGVLTTWLLDLALGPPIGPQDHRARRTRHFLAARTVRHQCVDRARRGEPAGADIRHRERLLRDRDDGDGGQRRDRRLQPGRRRLLDRQGRDRLSGQRDDRRRQSQGHLRPPRRRRRSRIQGGHGRADPARRRPDRRRRLERP